MVWDACKGAAALDGKSPGRGPRYLPPACSCALPRPARRRERLSLPDPSRHRVSTAVESAHLQHLKTKHDNRNSATR